MSEPLVVQHPLGMKDLLIVGWSFAWRFLGCWIAIRIILSVAVLVFMQSADPETALAIAIHPEIQLLLAIPTLFLLYVVPLLVALKHLIGIQFNGFQLIAFKGSVTPQS